MFKRLSLSFIAAALLASAGCGFQLRGSIDLPPDWRRLSVTSPSPNSELTSALNDGLTANGIELVSTAEANYRLSLGREQFEQRNLTIGGNARAAEFQLSMRTTLQVTDRSGVELQPATELSVQKIMTHDPENPTGKVEEVRLLRSEMRTELAQQVLRQVRFLATSPAGAGSAP